MENEIIWKWLKHRLALYDLNFNKLASIHHVDRTCFTGLKNKPCPKFERILSNRIGLEPWDLWRDRYNADNQPNRISSRYPQHKNFIDHSENINDVNKNNHSETNG